MEQSKDEPTPDSAGSRPQETSSGRCSSEPVSFSFSSRLSPCGGKAGFRQCHANLPPVNYSRKAVFPEVLAEVLELGYVPALDPISAARAGQYSSARLQRHAEPESRRDTAPPHLCGVSGGEVGTPTPQKQNTGSWHKQQIFTTTWLSPHLPGTSQPGPGPETEEASPSWRPPREHVPLGKLSELAVHLPVDTGRDTLSPRGSSSSSPASHRNLTRKGSEARHRAPRPWTRRLVGRLAPPWPLEHGFCSGSSWLHHVLRGNQLGV